MRGLTAGLIFAAAATGGSVQSPPVDQAVMQRYEAHATVVTGQVTRSRDAEPWALSTGERVPVQQTILTGRDGYAHFEVADGGSFDVFANSKVAFRQNAGNAGDLLDVISGRVRVEMRPRPGQTPQRIVTPAASITSVQRASVSVAVDEDGAIRIDVLEGEVRVQHTLLPRNEPTIVRAVDAILVRGDQQISRRLDRGSVYRYAVRPLHNLWHGHNAKSGDPVEGNRLFSRYNSLE